MDNQILKINPDKHDEERSEKQNAKWEEEKSLSLCVRFFFDIKIPLKNS